MAVPTARPRQVRVVSKALAVTLTLAALMGAAGCGGTGEDPSLPADPSAASVVFGSNPAPSGTTTPPTVPAPKPPAYPGNAKAYAEAVLAAWKQGQTQRLGDLTTPQVQEQIIEIPGPPNQSWTYQMCDGAAGSSHCAFVNAHGDVITLRISNSLLGQAHAAVEVTLDLTEYPSSAQEYVTEFIEAWRAGNPARMTRLASAELTDYFTHFAPPDPYSTCADGAAGSTYVRIYNSDGLNYTVRVTNTALGGPHAITDRSDIAAGCV